MQNVPLQTTALLTIKHRFIIAVENVEALFLLGTGELCE